MILREHAAVSSRFDAFRIDPRELHVTAGYNVRDLTTPYAREKLEILKEEIREAGGVLVPLEVRLVGEEVHIVSGHRRHRAVMELIEEGVDIKTVPAVPEQRAVNDAERVLRLISHNSGEPLSQLEKAEVVRRLLNMGWERSQIAARFGYKTPASIANFELLLAAPEVVRQAVREGEISASNAVELQREHGNASATKLREAKETAKKQGRTKVTSATLTKPTKKEPKPRDRLGNAIDAIVKLQCEGITARTLATDYDTLRHPVSMLVELADWFYTFADELKERKNAA